MALLSRDTILAAEDLPRELVAVPEWGGEVYVRGLTALEADQIEIAAVTVRFDSEEGELTMNGGIRALWLSKCLCDEHGAALFAKDDAEALAAKSAAAVERCYEASRRLSGRTREAKDEALGNSGGGPSAALPSDSP